MNEPEIAIKPLSARSLPDFLAFFDHDAFADNPKWAFCYCQFLYVDHREVVWSKRTVDENRAAACCRVETGEMRGWLAYAQGRVVGWCSAAPRSGMHSFDDEPVADADRIGVIGCFVIAQPWRRKGIARRLLRAACDGFERDGLSQVQAFSMRGALGDGENHFGPLSLYLQAGFEIVSENDDGEVRLVLRFSS